MQGVRKIFSDKRSRIIILIIAAVCAAVIVAGGVMAKYIASNYQKSEMESSPFHISSNYLEEISSNYLEEENYPTYTVTDWADGFDILLYNYEKENVAQISELDMTYTVTAVNAAVSVMNQTGEALSENNGVYSFGKVDTTTYHTLHVTPNSDVGMGNEITITVKTTSPFQKTLTAKFKIASSKMPDYTVTDRGDGTVLVTVKTNDYQGTMTVNWDPSKLSPDNTNALMASWNDETHAGTFQASRNSTYELLFFKSESNNGSYSETTGTDTTITLN